MSDEQYWGMIKGFDIDNGELDGLSPQECFVLGYELAQVDELLESFSSFGKPVHVENKSRIEKSCTKAGRDFQLSWMDHDSSESWMWLKVKGVT